MQVDYGDPIYARDEATGLRGQGPALSIEGDAAPFFVPMIADLMLGFAFDRGSHYEMLNHAVVRKTFFELTAPDLVELAYVNMWNEISSRVELVGDPAIYQGIVCGGSGSPSPRRCPSKEARSSLEAVRGASENDAGRRGAPGVSMRRPVLNY